MVFNGKTFGFINGNITILSLIVGMYAAGSDKKSIIGAMVALLVADPLCDAYSLYIAEKEDGEKLDEDTQHISIVKYETIKMMLEVILTEREEMDENLGIHNAKNLSLPFKIAFNTLLRYSIIKHL